MQGAVTTRVMSSRCLQSCRYVNADALDDDGIWEKADTHIAAQENGRGQ